MTPELTPKRPETGPGGDPIARLKAGLDADEAAAKAALVEWNAEWVRYEREDLPDVVFAHITCQDPDRTLREVAAHREILAVDEAVQDAYTKALDAHARDATPDRHHTAAALDRAADVMITMSGVVRTLAAIYSDDAT